MSAAEALQAAHAAGIQLRIDGDDLILKAPAPPPAPMIDLLSRHKADVMRMLRPGELHSPEGGWSVEEWHVFFDERAGIAEFDGGLSRSDAEAQAFACCIVEWLNWNSARYRNSARSPPGRCLGCGDHEHGPDPLLPYGVEPTGYAWLHSRCWEAWHAARKREAVAALKVMGVGKLTATE
jgi:hypothetical protein